MTLVVLRCQALLACSQRQPVARADDCPGSQEQGSFTMTGNTHVELGLFPVASDSAAKAE